MTEIPDDVRVQLAKEYVRQNYESGEPWSMTIARAILAERERCAKVADRYAANNKGGGGQAFAAFTAATEIGRSKRK